MLYRKIMAALGAVAAIGTIQIATAPDASASEIISLYERPRQQGLLYRPHYGGPNYKCTPSDRGREGYYNLPGWFNDKARSGRQGVGSVCTVWLFEHGGLRGVSYRIWKQPYSQYPRKFAMENMPEIYGKVSSLSWS